MDRDGENPDSPEGEIAEEGGWYFDLPKGAWERQEAKNRELRQRVRKNIAEDEADPPRRDAFSARVSQPREIESQNEAPPLPPIDDFTAVPPAELFEGLNVTPFDARRRPPAERLDAPPAAPDRDETDRSIEWWLQRVRARAAEEHLLDDLPREAPGVSASSGPGEGPVARKAESRRPDSLREAEPDPPTQLSSIAPGETGTRSRWDEMLDGPEEMSLVEGMRRWATRDPIEAPLEAPRPTGPGPEPVTPIEARRVRFGSPKPPAGQPTTETREPSSAARPSGEVEPDATAAAPAGKGLLGKLFGRKKQEAPAPAFDAGAAGDWLPFRDGEDLSTPIPSLRHFPGDEPPAVGGGVVRKPSDWYDRLPPSMRADPAEPIPISGALAPLAPQPATPAWSQRDDGEVPTGTTETVLPPFAPAPLAREDDAWRPEPFIVEPPRFEQEEPEETPRRGDHGLTAEPDPPLAAAPPLPSAPLDDDEAWTAALSGWRARVGLDGAAADPPEPPPGGGSAVPPTGSPADRWGTTATAAEDPWSDRLTASADGPGTGEAPDPGVSSANAEETPARWPRWAAPPESPESAPSSATPWEEVFGAAHRSPDAEFDDPALARPDPGLWGALGDATAAALVDQRAPDHGPPSRDAADPSPGGRRLDWSKFIGEAEERVPDRTESRREPEPPSDADDQRPPPGEWPRRGVAPEASPSGFEELLGEGADELVAEADRQTLDAGPLRRSRSWAPQHEVQPGAPAVSPPPWREDEPFFPDPSSAPAPWEGLDDDHGDWDAEAGLVSDGGARPQKHQGRSIARELIETGLLALLVFLAVRASFQNFKVDGASMFPTLENGQFLIVNKLIYSEVDMDKLSSYVPFVDPGTTPKRPVFHGPQRGDIIVLKDPRDTRVDLIKRVIGLPGESVEIVGGRVYINDFLLDEPYIKTPWHDNRPKVSIPAGEYFVMGDNRDNSLDSRSTQVGLVPKDLIIGKAMLSYWPMAKFGLAPNEAGNVSTKDGRPKVTAQALVR